MKAEKFIKGLEDKYDIKISLSYYTYGKYNGRADIVEGRIEYLYLSSDVSIENLWDLFPIAHNLRKLDLSCDINSLDGIEKFSQLVELDLSYTSIAPDLKALEKLEHLRHLNISGIELQNTSILGELQQLESLNISSNEFTHVLGLEGMKFLKKLSIQSSVLKNTDHICQIDSLTHLNLRQSDMLTKLDGLEKFKNLRELVLYECDISNSSELSKLQLLPKLELLDLSFTPLTSLVGIGEILSLRTLICQSTEIARMGGLDGLENLELLDFSNMTWHRNGDDVFVGKIEGLENLTKLKRLYLNEQNIEKIEGLKHLTNLELLRLFGNKIERVENLPIDSLKGLDLSYNNLSEVLGDMPYMQELLLIKNNIKHINIDWLHKIRKECLIDLRGNPIEETPVIPQGITIKTGEWKPQRIWFSKWEY